MEVNVAQGAAVEDGASGGRLSAAVSLSLFLTTRLSQQMAATLTQGHHETADNRVGWCESKLRGRSRTDPLLTNRRSTAIVLVLEKQTIGPSSVLFVPYNFLLLYSTKHRWFNMIRNRREKRKINTSLWENGIVGILGIKEHSRPQTAALYGFNQRGKVHLLPSGC